MPKVEEKYKVGIRMAEKYEREDWKRRQEHGYDRAELEEALKHRESVLRQIVYSPHAKGADLSVIAHKALEKRP